MTFPRIAAATLIATCMGTAHADSVTYTSAALPSTETDWRSFADLQQFDPSLGTLQQVQLTLEGNLTGSASAENTNTRAAMLTLNLRATLSLLHPTDERIVLVSTTPLVSQGHETARFDGSLDFAGTSGISLGSLAATSSANASFTDSATRMLFTGTGSLQLPLVAVGESYAAGSGNLWVDFSAYAGGRASVTYTYASVESLPAVPEPATWALLAAGLAAVGWKSSRRSA